MRERALGFAFGALQTALALLVAAVLTVAIVKAAGANVHDALAALWAGALGNQYAVINTLVKTSPLLLTGLGLAIAFRARMWNIGGQGQFLAGSMLASFVATNVGMAHHWPAWLLLPAILAAGAAAGGVWAGMAAAFKLARSVPEVISTIMLNFVAVQLLSYLIQGPLRRGPHSRPATAELDISATLPPLIHNTSLHAGLLVAAAAAVLVWLMLNATRTGFSIKVVGASPEAARLAGYAVGATTATAMIWSGALCGLAGAAELSGVTQSLSEGYAPEYGFTAIAVALLGRLQVGGIVLAALLFGALSAGSDNMERSAGVSHELGFVVEATILLTLLAAPAIRWLRAGPRAVPDLSDAQVES